MSSTTSERRPTWELLDLFPLQGDWSVEDYLALETNRLVEFSDGYLEFLPMPDELHQDIVAYIHDAVRAVLQRRGGGVTKFAPFKVRVREKRFREPDLCVLLDANDPRRGRKFWAGADLVVEIVSPDDPDRDYAQKRQDYAIGGIREYWIVDPQAQLITVLILDGDRYTERGTYQGGQRATSAVLDGFEVDVTACFALANATAATDEPPAASR